MKSSVALHGVGATSGSNGENLSVTLELLECSLLTVAPEEIHWTAQDLGTGHGYLALPGHSRVAQLGAVGFF